MKPLPKSDAGFMRRALHLAAKGRGQVSPNPMVGCVLVRGGEIVGEGWHARFGGPHAEPGAIRKAGPLAKGASVYVTMEPCCYTGKTPPCTEALIKAGVRRVYAAMKDPNPLVAGKGLRRLKHAGIAVSCGLLESEARSLNRGFTSLIKHKRPYVILKAAASLDGRIETAAKESKWITSPQARRLSRRMRADVDAILVGVNTVLADNPRLTAAADTSERAIPRGNAASGVRWKAASHRGSVGRHPLRVILDTRLRSSGKAKVYRGPGKVMVASAAGPNGIKRGGASHIRLPRRRRGLDLNALLKELGRQGVASLLVEGGSAVHTSFLEAGLVDEVRLFIAPRLIGGKSARTFFEGRGFRRLADALWLKELEVRRVGPDILITGFLGGK